VDEPFVPGSKEFEERFFHDSGAVTLQIDVLQEMYDELCAVARRQGLELSEVARAALGRGLACARADDYLGASDAEQARVARQLLDLESRLAVMRYSAFSFMRDNQTLEMQNAALRNANEGLKAAVDRLHQQEEKLRDRIRALQAEPKAAPSERSHHRANGCTRSQRQGLLARLAQWLGVTGQGDR